MAHSTRFLASQTVPPSRHGDLPQLAAVHRRRALRRATAAQRDLHRQFQTRVSVRSRLDLNSTRSGSLLSARPGGSRRCPTGRFPITNSSHNPVPCRSGRLQGRRSLPLTTATCGPISAALTLAQGTARPSQAGARQSTAPPLDCEPSPRQWPITVRTPAAITYTSAVVF